MKFLHYKLDIAPESIWNIVTTTPAAKANFVYHQESGYFQAGKKYYTTRQGIDSFLIKLTVSGGGILEYGGSTGTVGPGQFYWIDCMEWQKYYTDPEAGHWDVIWTHFSGATARAYYEAYCKLGGPTIGATLDGSPMYNILETLLRRCHSPDSMSLTEQNLIQFDVQTSGILTQLIMECFSSIGGNLGGQQQIPPVIRDIRIYLAEHYTEKITLSNLAERFNLDPFYLQKLFKRWMGQSPMEYLIYLRMTRAKSLIAGSTMTISEIAGTVGVDNISHFTRQFKKMEGMTPLQYRKLWPSSIVKN